MTNEAKCDHIKYFKTKANLVMSAVDYGKPLVAKFNLREHFSVFYSIGYIDLLLMAAQIQEFCHLSFDYSIGKSVLRKKQ